jgi:hypothetical protein
MVFYPIPGKKPGEPHSRMLWLFNAHMDFSSFIPSRVIDGVIPSTLVDYIRNLRRHVEAKHPS